MAFNPPPAPPNPAGVPMAGLPPGWMVVPPPSPPPKPGYWKDVRALVLLAFLVAFHTLINLYWLRADNHLIALDEAHHVQRSSLYLEALFPPLDEGVFSRALAALSIESPYPPLSHMLGAACMHFFGDTPDAAALSGSIALALLLLGVYLLARQGMAAHNAFLAALVTSFTPLVYGYSRLVMPDTLSVALVVWAFLGLVKSDLFRRPGWAVFFGLATGLALLSKQTALVYLALPALVFFLAGLVRDLLPANAPPGTETRHRWKGTVFNAALCLVIVTAACSGWYLKHLDFLYTWWSTQRGHAPGIFQPGIASRLEGVLPPVAGTPETRIALDPALSLPGAAAPAGEVSYPFTSLLEPFRRHWQRYLLYFVNDVAFLPLALVAIFGAFMLFRKKNRGVLLPLLVAWLTGTYLIFTGIFSLGSPRFLYGIAPAAAMLAVLALDAVPLLRLRRALWGLFIMVLALQFVNVSLASFGEAARVEIPLCAAEAEVVRRGNSGLTLYKDVINTGRYVIQPPVTGKRATESVLEAMAAHEAAKTGAGGEAEGAAAWYQVVSPLPESLGVDFYARRLPPVLPLSPPSEGEGEGEPSGEAPAPRGFAPIKTQSLRPEDTLPELAETRYVILYQPLEGNYIEVLEASVLFFTRNGFESIFNRAEDASGGAERGYMHVMARKEFPDPDSLTNLFDLYDMLDRDGKNYLLTEEDRARLEERYTAMVLRYTEPRPLNSQINLLGFHVKTATDDWSLVRLVVHAAEPPKTDLRVWMRAKPREEDRKNLFDVQQEQPALVWDFSPDPPATAWKQNQALVLTRPVMTHPLPYEVEIGLFNPDKETEPREKFTTEWVEFGATE